MRCEKIVWTEGMFLRPQHLQQHDRYLENQIYTRALHLSRYAWGFTSLAVDEQSLNLGKVVISEASGILPDGTLFEISGHTKILSLDIPQTVKNKKVMLALPVRTEGSTDTKAPDNTDVIARHVFTNLDVNDSNAGFDNVIACQCAQQDFVLFFEDELDEAYVAMPLLRIVECKSDNSVVVDMNFFPTFLHVNASTHLSGLLREIAGLLVHRGEQLALRVSSASQTGTSEIADFLLLQTINRVEPVFQHLGQAENVHPEIFYIHLFSLVGELSTFVEKEKRPPAIEHYNHADQATSFHTLMDHARYALSMVLEQHAIELPLQERKYGILVSPIHDRSLLTKGSFILAVQADMNSDKVRVTVPKQVKVGSVERIRQLVNLHLPGITLRALPVAPRQIPFHSGKVYFQLDFTTEEVAQLERSGGFAFHVSGTFPGLELQFWAIKE